MFLLLLFLALAGNAFAASMTTTTLEGTVKEVEDHYNRAKTLRVHFSERFAVSGHARPPETGTLTLRKVGKMRWDYTSPAGKLFVSDGKNVFLYTSRDNRVEKIPLKNTEDMRAPLAFLLGHLDLNKEFQDLEMEPARPSDCCWIKGNARRGDLPYRSVHMLIDQNGAIKELQVARQDTSILTFQLTNEVVNGPAPEALFQFTPPPGATIVDALQYGPQGAIDQ